MFFGTVVLSITHSEICFWYLRLCDVSFSRVGIILRIKKYVIGISDGCHLYGDNQGLLVAESGLYVRWEGAEESSEIKKGENRSPILEVGICLATVSLEYEILPFGCLTRCGTICGFISIHWLRSARKKAESLKKEETQVQYWKLEPALLQSYLNMKTCLLGA
ncbi:hypothetical protein COLO4_36633 [Corchorus olitorius]|uniref:Uncharacterized protein n=1 Tax=Corchorus olitorius TaxID=93759 RepID=A0A1R3G757_9ROSI|nr:hypothetical protein COLO4_36633 [Corchorus olitorius]